jgi:hypothetical protein
VERGLNALLADIIGSADAETQAAAFQQLATEHATEVYDFVARRLKAGRATTGKQHIGFGPNAA